MFSRQDLIAELPRLAALAAPPMEVTEFDQWDFESPSSEEEIWVFRGAKQDFDNGLLFWIKTLQAQDWQGREAYFAPYAEAGFCEPITEAEFVSLVAGYSGRLQLPLPPFLLELGGYRSGLRMYAEWNDVAAVAELVDSFVAFYWCTTA